MPHTASSRSSTWAGIIALVICAAMWSLNGPLIKVLGQAGVPGISIACWRSLLGGLVFLPWAAPRRSTLRAVHWAWPVASVLIFTLMTATFVIATRNTSAANAIILQYTSPMWVFVLGYVLLREKPRAIEGLVLLVAMLGVAIVFAGNPGTDLFYLFVALTSGFGYGTLTVLLRGLRPVPPLVVAGLNALGSGVLLLGPALVWGAFPLTATALIWLPLMALVQFTAPYALFSWALQRVEARRAALILLLEAILNPLWTFFTVGERPPSATMLGGVLILAGVAGSLLVARTDRPPAAATT